MSQLLALSMPGPFEMLVILGLGLLFFGKRLPDVGRSVGKTIIEFKKGMKEVENEVEQAANQPTPPPSQPAQLQQQYKFDPYTGQPMKFDPYTGKPIGQESAASEHTDPAKA